MKIHLTSQEFDDWRESARQGLTRGVPPDRFNWMLPELCMGDAQLAVNSPMVPGPFIDLARLVAMHTAVERWTLLYSLLWRLHHGEPALLSDVADAQVARAWFLAKAVQRDMMKMQAFVKFKNSHDLLVAWYKPEHHITEEMVPVFLKKYPEQNWILHTPELTVRWNAREIEFTQGLVQAPRFLVDDAEEVWQRYYHAQFDPRREHILMVAGDFGSRGKMASDGRPKTQAHPPETTQLGRLRSAAKSCLVCPFALKSTQTVFGEGPKRASLMLVGEQPGDHEDRVGHPFVGPAGALLDEVLAELGIPRDEVYVTNAVKHFKFTVGPKSKRRLHQKPNGAEIQACRPWLEKEVELVNPQVIVALGATAAQSVTGETVKITNERGQWLDSSLPGEARVLVSWHPSAILRSIDPDSRALKREQLKADLAKAWKSVRPHHLRAIPSAHAPV